MAHPGDTNEQQMTRTTAAENKARIATLYPALVRLTWAPDTRISTHDAHDVLQRSAALVNNVPYSILIDMCGINTMTLNARATFASDSRVLAAAFLGSGPMDRVLAAGYAQGHHPTQFFTSEFEAITWLLTHQPESNTRLPTDTDSP
ncbi:DUF7793 family protein [Arthrobacter sp. MDT2-16]